MKTTIRIPLDQYAYIELESDQPMAADEAMAIYKNWVDAWLNTRRTGPVLPTKEFNDALDQYLKDGTGNLEIYQSMSPEQQRVFQEIKKSVKRINDLRRKPEDLKDNEE